MSTKKDYYDILGISRSSSSQELKKAYLKLAKKYHPDKNINDKNSEQKFKELSEAYDILKDDQKRAAYDRFGHRAFENGNPSGASGGFSSAQSSDFSNTDMNDIFGDFFSDFMGSGRKKESAKSSQSRGSDLKYNLDITLEEAFTGIEKKINFRTAIKCSSCAGYGTEDRRSANTCSQCNGAGVVRIQQGFFAVEQTCSKCRGTGNFIKNPCITCNGQGRTLRQKYLTVNIPEGIDNNSRIRIHGEGEAGIRGGGFGDLYVFVSIKPHDIYRLDNSDLHFKLPISFTKAALGTEVAITLIDKSEVKLKIPVGTETGDQVRLKDKGMKKVRSSLRGDLYAHIYVYTPKKLNKKQTEMIEALDKELLDAEMNYKDKGFFSRMKNIWS